MEKTVAKLKSAGIKCSYSMGTMSIEDRKKMLERFEDGHTAIMATTHLDKGVNFDVSTVVLYELYKTEKQRPCVQSYYLRSSRSGTFGRKGVCISLGQAKEMQFIERAADIQIREIII